MSKIEIMPKWKPHDEFGEFSMAEFTPGTWFEIRYDSTEDAKAAPPYSALLCHEGGEKEMNLGEEFRTFKQAARACEKLVSALGAPLRREYQKLAKKAAQ